MSEQQISGPLQLRRMLQAHGVCALDSWRATRAVLRMVDRYDARHSHNIRPLVNRVANSLIATLTRGQLIMKVQVSVGTNGPRLIGKPTSLAITFDSTASDTPLRAVITGRE